MHRTLPALALLAFIGCDQGADAPTSVDRATASVDGVPSHLAQTRLGVTPPEGKADSTTGYQGPPTSGLPSSKRVWTVTRAWMDTDSAPGMAWGSSSGLTWDEKFSAWVNAMRKTPSSSWHDTFELITPWGKSLPAPTLECAEAAMFLRATFASWYGLPFYLSAYSPSQGQLYFGHFGVLKADGSAGSGYPSFATSYTDHTSAMASMSHADIIANWPSDDGLRKKYLTTLKDDRVEFLGDEAYAGAYFDEIFLNKRVGHFMLRLLTNLGSAHLVDSNRNTFNIKPEAIRPGDTLLQRWQSQGIGHTVVVVRAEQLAAGSVEVETVFGSMPRIQPKWYNPNLSKSYFTSHYSGGEGDDGDGHTYASLGGGLKRWRVTTNDGSRWRNKIPSEYQSIWIDSTDETAIAARPTTFSTLLGQLTDQEKVDLYLDQIAEARRNLSQRPASCANRTRRETAWRNLYEHGNDAYGRSKESLDREHRELEDYVFAELVYDQSKTCCWNRSTNAMFDVVMNLNEAHVWDDVSETCNPPIVFKARDGDYEIFADHAATLGVANEWVAWSDDEPCPQADTVNDLEAAHDWTPFCDIPEAVLDIEDDTPPDGNTDNGNTDNGNTDNGNTDNGNTDNGGSTPVEDGVKTCSGAETPPVTPILAFALLLLLAIRRRVTMTR